MDAVRRRLAPIRGIPTKSGKMADPNADLKEVFDFIDELPKAPAKLVDNFRRWVSVSPEGGTDAAGSTW
jgi:histone-lysine N-methyltransferase SETD3